MGDEGFYECDREECGRKWNGEDKGVSFSMGNNTKTFCSLGCFWKFLSKKFDLEIILVR